MDPVILVLNAGSSSLKFALFAQAGRGLDALLRGQIECIGAAARFAVSTDPPWPAPSAETLARIADHGGAIALLLDWLTGGAAAPPIIAVGHRIVHGGADFSDPVLVTPARMDAIGALARLAPHHVPAAVAAMRAVASGLPDVRQVACFDTAFHATQPEVATRLALPADLRARGLRRYGFHGLSYEYVAGALAEILPDPARRGRVIVAHLGNGASLCALRDGRSVASTMGFSTLDGLVMGSRCGALDPGVLLYLMREEGYDLPGLTDLLYNRSGLLGLSGLSSDMRTLLASSDPRAAAAIETFCYRIVREAGSLVAALGGLDAFVFTGGIGAHAAPVRAQVCEGLAWLGLTLDGSANAGGETRISTAQSAVWAGVVPTDEERVIARHTARVLSDQR